ncbi:c-type cytochrome [Corticimicrobacter sp.]|uniref:c-type cytochrome n=1 Tax=Corticimicrobacter sp. TaxID=2678536 RepID=UPI0032DAF0A1
MSKKNWARVAALLWTAVVSTGAWSAETVAMPDAAKRKACLGCHTVERKMIGPAFNDVAAKYAGQADAEQKVAASILTGSSGQWGAIPMARNAAVKPEEAAELAHWIMSLQK